MLKILSVCLYDCVICLAKAPTPTFVCYAPQQERSLHPTLNLPLLVNHSLLLPLRLIWMDAVVSGKTGECTKFFPSAHDCKQNSSHTFIPRVHETNSTCHSLTWCAVWMHLLRAVIAWFPRGSLSASLQVPARQARQWFGQDKMER